MIDFKKNKIAVLYGGQSKEREVSLRSGQAVLDGLKRQGLNAHGIDAGVDLPYQLIAGEFDFVFNMMHGGAGEDGTISGLLETLCLPYTGSGVSASALAMHQLQCLYTWQGAGLPVPRFVYCPNPDLQLIEFLSLPLAIKPSNQGSSVGVTKLKSYDGFDAAFHEAAQYGPVIAQEWIQGKEYTVGIVGDVVLPSIWIEPKREFYDYDAKYGNNSGTQYHCPSGLNAAQEQAIQHLAKRAYDLVGCRGWGRVDVLCDQQGQFYLLEINPIPGMTETSLVPKAAKQHGWSFEELLLKIMEASQ